MQEFFATCALALALAKIEAKSRTNANAQASEVTALQFRKLSDYINIKTYLLCSHIFEDNSKDLENELRRYVIYSQGH
uniref:Uncharacterized protein n=1 Tax=Glossina pallidipes TaxID=7398 RepID=A0A1A9Z766_GLOPL